MPADSLSLFVIEEALAELVRAREEVTDPEEQQAVDAALAEYVTREVQKVDNIRAYLRHCEVMADAAKQEAEIQRGHAQQWETRAARLKDICLNVMINSGKKKLEGMTGSLAVKGNGGRAPVTITDEGMIPDELCEYVGAVSGPLWLRTVTSCPWLDQPFAGDAVRMVRTVRKSAVGDALKNGAVAGARLDLRGQHLEVK